MTDELRSFIVPVFPTELTWAQGSWSSNIFFSAAG